MKSRPYASSFIGCIQTAYEAGIRTFVTSDVYGNGKADELLGRALRGIDRGTYSPFGMIGHDFYEGRRQGSRGYPRFTDPELRGPGGPGGYVDFIRMAVGKELERCGTDRFDLLMLHNPDELGYTSEPLWDALAEAKESGLTPTASASRRDRPTDSRSIGFTAWRNSARGSIGRCSF